MNPDLIVILGPTATGKTQLAVMLARKLNGEIISADSRQVYRGMDIGTGKDLSEYNHRGIEIKHHLIDILDPEQDFSVYHFQKHFTEAFNSIVENKVLPILCGGTGLYIDSVLRHYEMHEVPADHELRAELEAFSKSRLQEMLKALNPDLHNTTDLENHKRLIRAIEIAQFNLINKKSTRQTNTQSRLQFNPLVLGVRYPRDIIRERISYRLRMRLKEGMIEEVDELVKAGLPHTRLAYFGLEYRYISSYLLGELSWNDMFQKLNTAIHQFAKRQMTFFRHMERNGINIHWLDGGSPDRALRISKDFISNS